MNVVGIPPAGAVMLTNACQVESGTTAVAILFMGSDLHIAHVGDSRAIIGHQEEDGSVGTQQGLGAAVSVVDGALSQH